MGALTIKMYSFETRPWELLKICVPNIITDFPAFLMVSVKNTEVVRILPWARNSFISNSLRFSFSFIKTLLFAGKSIYEKNKTTLLNNRLFNKENTILSNLYISITHQLNFNSTVLKIFNFLHTWPFLLKNKPYTILNSSNSLYLQSFYLFNIENLNDVEGDAETALLFDFKTFSKFPDFYYNFFHSQFLYTEEEISICEEQDLLGLFENKINIVKESRILDIGYFYTKRLYTFYLFISRLFSQNLIISHLSNTPQNQLLTLRERITYFYPYHDSCYAGILTKNVSLSIWFSKHTTISSLGFVGMKK